jgi:hypothetical protein
MDLNPQNAFGVLLLDLIEAQYGVIDNGLIALMQTTGLTEQEVVGIINGDLIVESEQLLSGLIQAFPDADQEDISVVIDVAVGVSESDANDLATMNQEAQQTQAQQAQAQAGQGASPEAAGGGYDAEGGMGAEGAEGGFGRRGNTVNFSRQVADTLTLQQQQINQLTAGISNFQAQTALAERLKDIDTVATKYVNNGMLPPSYKLMLVGEFKNDKERLAKFGQIAQQNGVDVPSMLFATEYAISMLADASQFVEFSDYSLSEDEVRLAEFSAGLDAVVADDFAAIFNS